MSAPQPTPLDFPLTIFRRGRSLIPVSYREK